MPVLNIDGCVQSYSSILHACVSCLAGCWDIVMQSLPQISVLDGLDRLGNPSHLGPGSLCDIPGLEDYVDLLLSSDTSRNEVVFFILYWHSLIK